MANYNGFDINTVATPKPWGAREEQAIKDIIDTLVGDAITGAKNTSGHVHNKLYYDSSNAAITIDGSGNVGIGTASPSEVLDVVGTIYVKKQDDQIKIQSYDQALKTWRIGTGIGLSGANRDFTIWESDLGNALTIEQSTGNVGLGYANPSTPSTILNLRTDTSDDGLLLETVTGGTDLVRIFKDAAASNGRIDLYASGSSTVQLRSSGVSVFNGGNVGIGIASPDGTLHVHSATAGTVDANENYDELVLESGGNTGLSILAPDASLASIGFGSPSDPVGADISWLYDNHELVVETAGASGFMTFKVADSAAAMTIDTSGNVGINRTVPSAKLDIDTSAAGTALIIRANSQTSGYQTFGINSNADFEIGRSGTLQMVIDASGNVGINRTVPGAKLDIDTGPAGTALIIRANSQTSGYQTFGINSNADFEIGRSGSLQMVIDTNGNVGIGSGASTPTFSTGGGLHVGVGATTRIHLTSTFTGHTSSDGAEFSVGSDGHLYVIQRENLDIRLWTNATERVTIDANGNVGIGKAPVGKLQVHEDSALSSAEVGLYMSAKTDDNNTTPRASFVAKKNGTNNGQLVIQTLTSSSLTDKVWVLSSGNVGLGTDNPLALLDVSYGGNALVLGANTGSKTRGDNADKSAQISFVHYDIDEEPICFSHLTCGAASAVHIGGGEASLNGVSEIKFYTAATVATLQGTERMNIDNSGLVTVVGTLAANDLDVTTNIDTATLRTTSTVGIGIASPDGTCHIHTGSAGTVTAAAADLVVESNATCGITILSPDDFLSLLEFGTPTDNTSAELRWDYTNTLFSLWTDIAGGEIVLGTGTQNEAVRIDSSGNVGINVTTPSALLDVNGTSEFNGAIGVGANLISYNGGASTTGLSFNSSDIGNITNTALAVGDSHVSLTFVDNTALAAGVGGGINFQGVYTAGGATNNFAGIKGVKANGTDGNYSGQLHFQTRLNGSTAATNMIIDEAGFVGIGTTTPGNKLDIITGATTSSGFHLGEAGDEGGWLTSTVANEMIISAGSELVSGSWYARSTTASIINMSGGNIGFIADTGLTDGNTYSVTTRMTLANDGGLYMAGAGGGSQGAGTINATAVYDDGSGPLTDYVFEKHYDKDYVIPEDNEPAKTFELRYEIYKSLDSFISFVKGKKCLPAFDNGGERLPIGTGYQKLLETVETLVYHFDSINNRLKALETA